MFSDPEHELFVAEAPGESELASVPGFQDFGLRNRKELARLVLRLFRAGMVRGIKKRRGPVGITMFTVVKRADVQRLILDMRRVNRLFRKPPSCHFASLEAFVGLDLSGVDSDVPVVGFAGDVPDYFYRLALPEWLHEHL